jgi:antitoxin FitA
MFCTRVSVQNMSKMIQVRNVPDPVHRVLKARAAAAGMSLSDYIKRDLEDSAARPTLEELDARIAARGRSRLSRGTIVSALREVRDA